MDSVVYSGRFYYEPSRIHAAAVYCSDGRLGVHFDDFLQNGLHLPRYDRVALPGGPAALLGPDRSDTPAPWDALAFLIDVHELHRVLLIAHEGCAYYSQRLGASHDRMEGLQCRDLTLVADRIRTMAPHLQIDTYFARTSGNRIVFERAEACPLTAAAAV